MEALSHPDRVAFLLSIAATPDDDTPRLVFADWLEEYGGDPAQAKYIRRAIAWAAERPEPFPWQPSSGSPLRKCPCPACGGTNRTFDACPCGGSGDLFQPFGDGAKPRTVTFARGFVDSVECTAADVWREERRDETAHIGGHRYPTSRIVTVPTEWALAVVRCTPCVRFVATDLAPRHVSDVLGKGWTWPRRMTLPDPVRDLLASTGGVQQPAFNSGYVRWETEQLCRDALAVALGKWVRVAAYPAASVG